MQYKGQNSFRQYFQAFLFQSLEPFLLPKAAALTAVAGQECMPEDETKSFFLQFFTDAVLISIFRWISDGAAVPPEQFLSRLRSVSEILLIGDREYEGDK